jgi:hypothetical protein
VTSNVVRNFSSSVSKFMTRTREVSCCTRNRSYGKKGVKREKGFRAHGYRCFLHFQIFENFKTSHFYVFKKYNVKYIDGYVHEEFTQTVAVKSF